MSALHEALPDIGLDRRESDRHQPHDPGRFLESGLWTGMTPSSVMALLTRTSGFRMSDRVWRSLLEALPRGGLAPLAQPRPTSHEARALGCSCMVQGDGEPGGELLPSGGARINLGWAIARACVLHGQLLNAEDRPCDR